MALDYFMAVDGIEGESMHAHHQKQLPITHVSFGSFTMVDRSSGQAQGNTIPKVVTVVRTCDSSSMVLGQTVASRKVLANVRIFVHDSARNGDVLVVTLTNAFVESQQIAAMEGGNSIPSEEITLSYASISVLYRKTTSTGLVDAGSYTFTPR